MKNPFDGAGRVRRRSVVLLAAIVLLGAGMTAWKLVAARNAQAAAAAMPEPIEVVTAATATVKPHRDATTSVGTVLATRSVSLRNEVAGTVRTVRLEPGKVVETGEILVALDVAVERAELKALEARAELARTTLARYERMAEKGAASAMELDRLRAENDIAQADIARLRAVIERKTIRAPFRARVGIADVHPGQFLEAGTRLTTLQGVDEAVHVDFEVAQDVAAGLSPGDLVEVSGGESDTTPITARVTAVDARVDPDTRNATVRARIDHADPRLRPGASVQVRVPVGPERLAVFVPVNALRRGPTGDHVFVVEAGEDGQMRAHLRRVETGGVVDGEVLIASGLEEGERLATSGSFKLREGVLVHLAGNAGSDAEGPDATSVGAQPADSADAASNSTAKG